MIHLNAIGLDQLAAVGQQLLVNRGPRVVGARGQSQVDLVNVYKINASIHLSIVTCTSAIR